ncbi:hypothetical protein BN12_1560046 [Nostocoides japonicum T1-X7]|uniref:Uncharacterized protein n=1 Tax=Nostocoides japonicum T1-X7 TaxID=1194083 RepID=A0A077LU46_9MICO|nr:hypothetical protein BN12_1560046 [Tetrasphaera japonica T1-X7]
MRAEVSRLRRAVGALVAASPYRIAEGVRIVCEEAERPPSRRADG